MILNLGGTVRTKTAEATLARLTPLLPLFGITRVAAQEGLGGIKIPVSVCYRPDARLLSTSQGKGISRALADVSAIMESIESFHAERLEASNIIETTSNLRRMGKDFIDPVELNPSQFRSVYSENDFIHWIPLIRLSDQKEILVPRSYICLDSTKPMSAISSYAFEPSTNGVASGNTLEEAIVHGLYELIERHCISEFFNLLPEEKESRVLDLTTIQNASHLQELMQLINEGDLSLVASARHNVLGIPVFKAFVQEKNETIRTIGYGGYGAHPLPEIALSRAITEAIQGRVTLINSCRDDVYPRYYQSYNTALSDYLPPPLPDDLGRFHWKDVPHPPFFSTFNEILKWTLDLLNKHGFQNTCIYNHQRPEYGDIPVVSVISPGLGFNMESLSARD